MSQMRHMCMGGCVRGVVFGGVWPCRVQNIQNIKDIDKKNLTYQWVRTKKPFCLRRNIAERAGTLCSAEFWNCSGIPFLMEQAVPRANRGLWRFGEKSCSGMFRQMRQARYPTSGRVVAGLEVCLLKPRSACSGGWETHTHVCGVFTP